MTTVADIADFMNQFAPTQHAAEWDNVGLIVGERKALIRRVLTCLTVTPPVVDEALKTQSNLIVTHHPVMFRAVQRLTDQTPEGRMLLTLVRGGVAVYSPHTSFDNCAGGINDLLAQKLGLQSVKSLRSYESAKKCKVVVFVPESDLAKVSDAMFAAGAGIIGEYSECSFRLMGTGTFFGSDEANPTVGKKGQRESVSEWRLEAICDDAKVDAVVDALRRAHSYEEPAFDLYNLRPNREPIGEGRVGQLASPVPLDDFAKLVRQQLNLGPVHVVGDGAGRVQRVALACGAAGEFLRDAVREKADAFLTGEMRFHDYLSAQAQGIALVLPGHYATERFGVVALAERLKEQFPAIEISASAAETDPVRWV
jgi:dinuclear metal center YbgI/SA1388 family protein